jgi:hypothetical protein
VHELSDGELAGLARMSVDGSDAPADVRARLRDGIDAWLAAPEPAPPETPSPEAASPRTQAGPRPEPTASPWPTAG